MVVSELRGEKIDIIPWNNEPARFVAKALSPARVREVYLDDDGKEATVVVPDDQLALAIGKEGMNARLAARLTGWKIDIQSDTEFAQAEADVAFGGGGGEEELSGRCSAILVERQALPERVAARLPLLRRAGAPGARGLRLRLRRRHGGRGGGEASARGRGGRARRLTTTESGRSATDVEATRSRRRERRPAATEAPRPRTHRARGRRRRRRSRRSAEVPAGIPVEEADAGRGVDERARSGAAPAAAGARRSASSAFRRRWTATLVAGRETPGPRRVHLPAARLLRAGRARSGASPGHCDSAVRVDPALARLYTTRRRMANGGKPNRPLRPRGGSGPGNGRRRVVIDNAGGASARPAPGRPRPRRRAAPRRARATAPVPPTGPVSVESGVSVRDFSQALGVSMPNIIKILMDLGQMRTATQSLTDEEVELIAAELEREVTIKHAGEEEEEPESYDDPEEALEARPPVVTIMGHVDHGKTTLLDAIRNAQGRRRPRPAASRSTSARTRSMSSGRKVTFLDTPGHEAFTAMRARGAKVTDIAVLVVAADDGVMPQTKESISHARAADVPIVVAINKIDLPDANLDRVKAELAQEGLQPEEWGGTTQFAEVSAKTQTGLDELLEKILLVADLELDLQREPEHRGVRPDHRVAPRRRPRPGRDDARPSRHAEGRRRDRRRRRVGQGARALQLQGREAREGRSRASRSRSSASTSRRPPASSAASSSTSAPRAITRSGAPSVCAASSSRRSAAAASRSRTSSTRCRRARSQTSTSSSRATSSAPSRRSSRSSRSSSTPRCASTSSTRASARSRRTTSCSRPRPNALHRRLQRAAERGGARARAEAKASRSASTPSSTS